MQSRQTRNHITQVETMLENRKSGQKHDRRPKKTKMKLESLAATVVRFEYFNVKMYPIPRIGAGGRHDEN